MLRFRSVPAQILSFHLWHIPWFSVAAKTLQSCSRGMVFPCISWELSFTDSVGWLKAAPQGKQPGRAASFLMSGPS